MLLWLCFAFLTAAIVALLLRPLRGASGVAVAAADADLAVYRDQLRELEAERDRGLLIESELESARAEIARRLLKRAGGAESGAAPADETSSLTRARKTYTAIAALIPVVAVGVYLVEGSPHLPDQPMAARKVVDVGQSQVGELIARVEERLRTHPEDGKGWDVIAPVYLRLQRYADAAHAFAEANRLEGENVRRLLGFAEATMLAENGIVTEPVRRATLRVLELEPDRTDVRVWLALGKEQDGDLKAAAAEYKDILDKAPADAAWREAVQERLVLVEKKLRGEPVDEKAPAAQPEAPQQPQAPDIAKMSPAERDAFIAQMVEGLAARLKDNGKDLAGWLRLIRAYTVLGRAADAEAALASARQNFAGDSAALAEIDKAASAATQEPSKAP